MKKNFEFNLSCFFVIAFFLNCTFFKSEAQVNFNWAFIPTSTSLTQNIITAAVTDHQGNIIEVGKVTGHADMDPGTGPADTSYTPFFYNHYLSKTTANGQLVWIYYFEDNSQLVSFDFKGLTITQNDEIVVAGNFIGKIDFDLQHSGIDTLRSLQFSYPDYFLAKYDASGNHLWALHAGNNASGITAQAITLLPNNTILLAANPTGVTDIDPSNLVHTTIGGSANIIAYTSTGNYLWNNAIIPIYSYGVSNNSLDCDSSGNSYLMSVGYYELTVSKFSANGTIVWSKTIGDFPTGARVNPQSMLVDKSTGDFYVAGTFDGLVDFNPNAPVLNYNCLSALNADGFIAKFDSSMNPIWVNQYVGKVTFGNYSLAYDGSDIAAVGNYIDSVNFGNGFSFYTASTYSPFYLKINPAGAAIDGYALSGIGQYNSIFPGTNHTFVITGNILAWVDMDPGAPIYNLHAGTANFFTAVYQLPSPSSILKFDLKPQNNISFYPNPFNQELTLRIIENEKIEKVCFYTALGRKVFESSNVTQITLISTSAWPAGTYFACITTPSTRKYFKIIKQ